MLLTPNAQRLPWIALTRGKRHHLFFFGVSFVALRPHLFSPLETQTPQVKNPPFQKVLKIQKYLEFNLKKIGNRLIKVWV